MSSSEKPVITCKPWYFLFTLCSVVFIQSALVTGVLSAEISTIEKRFGFRSSQSGSLFSVYDAAVLVVVIPCSHFGGRWHTPKTLAIGTFVLGLGSFMMAMPHFLVSSYRVDSTGEDQEMCNPANFLDCSGVGNHDGLFAMFVCAQAIIGVGAATLYTLGPLYLDQAVAPTSYPMYLGVFYAVAAIGPAFGFIGGSQALNIYVDTPTDSGLVPTDPQWLGAWWLPFLACGAWAIVTGFPMLLFPRQFPRPLQTSTTSAELPQKDSIMPSAAEWAVDEVEREQSKSMARQDSAKETACPRVTESEDAPKPAPLEHLDSRPSGVNPRVRRASSALDVPSKMFDDVSRAESTTGPTTVVKALKEILSNRVFVFNSLAQCTETFVVSACSAFLPKFLSTQFRLTDATAGSLTGLIVIPGAAGGILLGGFLVKHFRMTVEQTARLCVMGAVLSALFATTLLIGCSESSVAGVTVPYPNGELALLAQCNQECSCVQTLYDPVCGADGLAYYSPCHAGCAESQIVGDKKVYANCSCIGAPLANNSSDLPLFAATSGACASESLCTTKLALFLVALFVLMVFTFMNNSPAIFIMVRTLGPHGPLGLSLNSLFFRLLGGIPGPVLFGTLLDQACIATKDDCGSNSCEIYDMARMRAYFFLLGFLGKAISTILFALSWRATRSVSVIAPIKDEEGSLAELP